MSDLWPMIHTEREACAELFATLTPEQWITPSLCAGWSVRDVAGHMIATAEMTPPKFFLGLAKAGFKFNAMAERDAERCRQGDGATLAARMKEGATRTNGPPGPKEAMLGEAVIHGEDVRRPLGATRSVPEEALVTVADFYKKSNLIVGAKKRIAGLHLETTDASWSSGEGPEVRGPLVSLIMAMTGRAAALPDLSGEGLATLTTQM